MKVYELTFVDLEHGKIVRWISGKRQIAKLIRDWKQRYPLRKLMDTERIEIPNEKQAFLEWLNATAGGANDLAR